MRRARRSVGSRATAGAPSPSATAAVLRDDALAIVKAGIAAADPADAVRRALTDDGGRIRLEGGQVVDLSSAWNVTVIGAGKAAAAMARGALEVLGSRVRGGVLAVPHGTAAPPPLETWQAAHPAPDAHGLAAAAAALRAAREADGDALVLCLLSGGASALWAAPPPGVGLTELRAVTRALMEAGAPIRDLNAVRKHLSTIAGGRLACATAPAALVTLAVSDVVGGAPDVIASGPTVPDPTTFADALEALRRWRVQPPASVQAHLHAGLAGDVPETPKPGDPRLARTAVRIVASGRDALAGAAAEAERRGYRAVIVADDVEGEARDVARHAAGLVRATLAEGAEHPVALLMGGETTVTVRGSGRGGRNQELALALAVELEGVDGVLAAAAGTDGVDGPTEAAGGIADGGTVARGQAQGLDAGRALADNDSHTFLAAAGDLIVTGPTGTNVNDLLVILVASPDAAHAESRPTRSR
jgi:glycerate 2-kinase